MAARIIAETGGNPLALLELAGLLTPDQLAGRSPLPQRLPVGRGMPGHFLRRVKLLPQATRSLLLLASAAWGDDPAVLWRAAALLGLGPDAAGPAVAQDILRIDPRVDFRHPLIRSAVYEGARLGDRRRVHEAWASIAGQDGNPDEAAWHRAAATVVPEEQVAADLERSAARAEQRGGYVAQAAFLTRAAELTLDRHDRAVRLFAAAQAHLAAGDSALAEALLDQAAPGLAAAGMQRRGAADRRVVSMLGLKLQAHPDGPLIGSGHERTLPRRPFGGREGRLRSGGWVATQPLAPAGWLQDPAVFENDLAPANGRNAASRAPHGRRWRTSLGCPWSVSWPRLLTTGCLAASPRAARAERAWLTMISVMMAIENQSP